MSSVFDKLLSEGLLNSAPKFIKNNVCYEVLVGSHAYGTNLKDSSDFDVYGVCIPKKETLFPHLQDNYIDGFGERPERFDNYVQHGVDYHSQKQYDLTMFGIVRFFQLCMENNPNMLESLFVSGENILYINQVGNIIRDNRHKFLHKGCYYKLVNYAKSQLHKMSSTNRTGKRKELYDLHGFDSKFMMNLYRLTLECEQILTEHTLDLRKNSDLLKSVRRGEVSEEECRKWFAAKEPYLEKLYQESKLPYGPNEKELKSILLSCLEHHFGSLSSCVTNLDKYEVAIRDIQKIVGNL